LEAIVKVKELIALLQKEDPPVPIKLQQGVQDQAAILIE
jgi:hypothetical protein